MLNWSSLIPPKPIHIPTSNGTNAPVCGHIFTTYILPDILHLASFIIGFMYFRITEGEAMYSLMEKVCAMIKYQKSVLFFFLYIGFYSC